jgi:NAD-dependent deacetylase
LHERAGSRNVLHLHGDLLKVQYKESNYILDWKDDLDFGDVDLKTISCDRTLLFGLAKKSLHGSSTKSYCCRLFVVIGTSLQVYPAAGLLDFTKAETPLFYIDPKPIKIPNLKYVASIPRQLRKE